MAQPKLGKAQTQALAALRREGRWTEGCGWHCGGLAATRRIMDSLVKKGLAQVDGVVYTPIPASR